MSEVLSYDAAALASKVAMEQAEEVICPVCKVCFWSISFHDNVSLMRVNVGTIPANVLVDFPRFDRELMFGKEDG